MPFGGASTSSGIDRIEWVKYIMIQQRSNSSQQPGQAVAIIGLGCLFPGSENLAAYWEAIKTGRNAIGDIPADHWSTADYYDPDPRAEDKTYGRRGGFLSPVAFEPLKYGIVPNDISAIDSTQLLGLVAADQALRDAGYPAENGYDHRRTAVMLGVTGALKMVVSLGSRLAHPQLRRALADSGVDEATAADVLRRFANEFTPWQENSFPGLLGNVTAGRIANRLNLGGANLVVDAACASSLAAVRQGLMELSSGQADLVVTGGLDTFSDPFMYTCFSKTPALSPSGDVRAYDQDGDGTMLGEGLGVVVLKRLEEARADGDRIYAVIRSVGSSSDGKGAAIFAPTADGQRRALNNAYDSAGVNPGSVELVEGHGTGTAVGDAVEAEALSRVFGQSPRAEAGRPWCALGSVKSQIGHTKAAAGAAGLIKVALSLKSKTLPPTIKVKKPLPALTESGTPFHLSSRCRPWFSPGPRRAGVSAFGFGGSNFHCVLEEAEAGKLEADPPLDLEILAFSGADQKAVAERLAEALAGGFSPALAAESRRDFRADDQVRLVLVTRADDWSGSAEKARRLAAETTEAASDQTAGVFWGHGPARGRDYGFLLVGPDRVRADMFRDLAISWPELFEPLNQAAGELAQTAPDLNPLDLVLYPPDLASARLKDAWSADLADPRLCSVVSRAVNEGLAVLLSRFGLRPAAVLGEDGRPASGWASGRVDLWLDLGPDGDLAAADQSGRILALAGQGDGNLHLARLLARLAAEGRPVDLAAWPFAPEAASAPVPAERSFSMMISGANHFVKKALPPAATGAAPTPAGGGRVLSLLETMTSETARLHQEFLNQQSETLDLLRRQMETGSADIPPSLAAAPPPVAQSGSPARLGDQFEPNSQWAEAIQPVPPIDQEAASVSLPSRPEPAPAVSSGWAPNRPTAAGVMEMVLAAVAAETGYPVEMLNPDMDLESDLGLDSIKKVEIMAVLSEKLPDVQGLGAETMNSASTLRDLVSLVEGPAVGSAPFEPLTAPAGDDGLWPILREVVAAETGYPQEMLTPQMRLADDLGLDSIKMVEIASVMSERRPGAAGVSADLIGGAQTLGELASALAVGGFTASAGGGPASEAYWDAGFSAEPEEEISAPQTSSATLETIMEVVSRETGYPRDMLNPAMDLEADLGLDSIKKVEIMAALSERLPQVEALSTAEVMAGLRTLGDLAELSGDSSGPPPAPAQSLLNPSPVAANPPVASIDDLLLEVVAAETGYPRDMLSFEASLEADLGLDSIKRVEIMSALSERLDNDSLTGSAADILTAAVTLGDLRDLVSGLPGEPAPAAALAPPALARVEQAAPEKPAGEARRRGPGRPPKNSPPAFQIEAAPWEVVRTAGLGSFRVEMKPLALTADLPLLSQTFTGLPPGARVVILAEAGPLADELTGLVRDRGQIVTALGWSDAATLDVSGGLDGLFMVWPGSKDDLDLPRKAFQTLRTAGPALLKSAEAGRKPLLMGLTFQGGSFGFAADSAPVPSSAALTGLVKTAAREWSSVRVRAVDLPLAACGPEAASYLPGLLAVATPEAPLEVGLADPSHFQVPGLVPYKLKNIRVRHLREGQTLLVTGGARGVTAAALKEIARAVGPRLVILGRSPLPPAEPGWMRDLKDEAAVREALFDRARVKPGPRELAQESRRLMAGREIRANLAAMEKAGAKVTYISGDFQNPSTLKKTLAEIRQNYGPIHGFMHGAGVLADSLIIDKKDEDFDLVFDTKARMADLILDELRGQPLNLVAFFSSSTARFGRRGQADYAAGNEVLNKLARRLSGSKHSPKCLSVNWGPWDGGMVNSGLKRLFEEEGVGLIPLDEGARLFAALVGAPKNDPVEVVVLGPDTDLTALG